MKVPYVNLKKENMESISEIHSAIDNVIKSGNYILGKEVSKFENNFKNLTNSTYAVGVNSGTDALILALKALDIGENDEVITVSNTFIATVSAILEVNAKPVLVDVMDDQNINYNDIEKVITPRTKAIIPVHLSGKPSKMYEILKIADKYELEVIEDCAQAVTARIGNKQVGNFGKIGCFSLHPLKNLSAVGDAGVITTNDESIYRKIKLLRNHGLESRDTCVVWGVNSRIDEVQASILNVKLQKLDGSIQKRRQFAKKYIDLLNEVEGITLPKEEKDEYCTYNTFVIQVEDWYYVNILDTI